MPMGAEPSRNADLAREREVAERAVRQAVRLCRAVRESAAPATLTKPDRTPATVADYGSQALICAALGEAFPDDPILAEEDSAGLRGAGGSPVLASVLDRVRAERPGADADAVLAWIDRGSPGELGARFWTLDPIDGTKGFLRGGQYAVALALIVGGDVRLAVLACPAMRPAGDESDGVGPGFLFVAERGRGTTSRPLEGEGPGEAVRVSERVRPSSEVRLCERLEAGEAGHAAVEEVAGRLRAGPPRRVDSQAKYALVARGDADAYLRFPKRAGERGQIWDHAAGALVASEAGAEVTDLAGRPLDFGRGRSLSANEGLLVSNGRVHELILEIVRSLAWRPR